MGLDTESRAVRSAYYTELGVNPATIMPVDILHNCELGFGKGIVIHNIRIFHVLGQRAVNMFNTQWDPRFTSCTLHYINPPSLRFCLVPTFSHDTI